MSSVLASLVPVFLVIMAGWLARVTGFVEEKHWPGLEKVTYVVFFPAIIIATLAQADLATVPVGGVGAALVVGIFVNAVALLLARRTMESRAGIGGPSFTSIFQGATRWNTFVALAVAGSLYGERGLALMAVAIAVMIPLLNLMAIGVLVRFAGGPPQTPRQIVIAIVTNPFIWSSAIGVTINATGLPMPSVALEFTEILGRAALAAGLLVVGAGLDMRRLATPDRAHWISIAAKMLVLPVVAVTLARVLGVGGDDLVVVAIASSVPTASGGYILAKQMGGDAPLMAEIITIQTLVAMLTMPVMITVLAL
ncbi:AEC family transporter [Salinarimonas ramus]|uniref:Transporter n=1 Tax=Salinarimonas ramus TaxID=690164 RepID=A0A917QFB4_9HYPH|nr:AEC family transporter [Salinarimonas ramus]GGK47862.1 transporter [Salinarimonas ramus]